jgi:hypothetical protein
MLNIRATAGMMFTQFNGYRLCRDTLSDTQQPSAAVLRYPMQRMQACINCTTKIKCCTALIHNSNALALLCDSKTVQRSEY